MSAGGDSETDIRTTTEETEQVWLGEDASWRLQNTSSGRERAAVFRRAVY